MSTMLFTAALLCALLLCTPASAGAQGTTELEQQGSSMERRDNTGQGSSAARDDEADDRRDLRSVAPGEIYVIPRTEDSPPQPVLIQPSSPVTVLPGSPPAVLPVPPAETGRPDDPASTPLPAE